jgi:hypothetical protein
MRKRSGGSRRPELFEAELLDLAAIRNAGMETVAFLKRLEGLDSLEISEATQES